MKHTYDQDFEYLEVNEADLQILSDPEVASANSQGPDATVTVEAENKKTDQPFCSCRMIPQIEKVLNAKVLIILCLENRI